MRQRPDEKLITAYFAFSLLNRGITAMFGKDETGSNEMDVFLKETRKYQPPMVEGDSAMLSRFVWGFHALGTEEGYELPPDKVDRYLTMVPRLSGNASWWLQQLVGTSGLAPPELWQVRR